MEYDFSELWEKNFWGFYQFKGFIEYAMDKDAQARYYKQLGAVQVDENGMSKIETPQELIDYMIKANEEALEMIKNQYIVFLFTRYEVIIQDTVKTLICNEPQKILKLVGISKEYEEAAKFSLKEFLNSESKEKYVELISERLSAKILSGKPTDVIKRIKILMALEDVDVDVLDEIMSKRNCIVHEGKMYKMELEELEMYYQTVEDLLKKLAKALKCIAINVVDKGNFLIEEE